MTIETEINRIKQNVANCYTALTAKGATLPASLTVANLAACIRTIPTGPDAFVTQSGDTIVTSAGTPLALDGISSLTTAPSITDTQLTFADDGQDTVSFSMQQLKDYVSPVQTQGRFVAASSAKIAYSDDGLTWTEVNNVDNLGYYLTYGNNVFMGARDDKIVFSEDGSIWDSVTTPLSGLTQPCYFKNNFYAFGYNTQSYLKTADGQSITTGAFSISNIAGSCCSSDTMVVVGTNKIAYTTNGTDWNYINTSVSTFGDVCYGNGMFVAPQYNSSWYYYSSDGVNWSTNTLPSSQLWDTICYGNGLFVVVASESNKFAYSSDGMNWTQGTLPATNFWSEIIYGNGIFVLVSQGMYDPWKTNQYLYSTDGMNWTAGTLPSSQGWLSVAYGEI